MAIGVQQADVWAAADTLLRAGEQPTVERVRRQLGRGSPNTVGPHLKVWFSRLGDRIAGRPDDAGVPDAVRAATTQLWNLASQVARDAWAEQSAAEHEELARLRDALTRDQATIAQKQAQLRQRELDLESAVRAAEAQAAAADARLRMCEVQREEAVQAHKSLGMQLDAAQGRCAALDTRLREEGQRYAAALQANDARHAAHERRWLAEIDELRQSLKKSTEDAIRQRKAVEQDAAGHVQAEQALQSQLTDRSQRVSELEGEVRVLVTQLQASKDAAHQAEAHAATQIGQLTQRVDELRAALQAKDHQFELLLRGPALPGGGKRSANPGDSRKSRGA